MRHLELYENFDSNEIDPFTSYGLFRVYFDLLKESPLWKPKHENVWDEIESYWLSGQEDGEDEDFQYYVDLTGSQVHDGAYMEDEVGPEESIDDSDFNQFIKDMQKVANTYPKDPDRVSKSIDQFLEMNLDDLDVFEDVFELPWYKPSPLISSIKKAREKGL